MKIKIIYSTFPTKKAFEKICKELLKNRLIVCANGWKINTLYSNNIENNDRKNMYYIKCNEYACILKTNKKNANKVCKFLLNEHPYKIPVILTFDCNSENKEYTNWLTRIITFTKQNE